MGPLELSVVSASLATLVAAPPAIGTGWLLARRDFWGKTLLDTFVHLPLVLPPVVTGYLLLIALGPRSAIGGVLESLGLGVAFSFRGVVVAAAVMGFPLFVRSTRVAIELVDVELEEAARTLGASPWSVLKRITLPLAMPGIVAGAVLSFARSLGEFGATVVLATSREGETRTLPIAIWELTQVPNGDERAAGFVGVSIGLSVVALAASEFLVRRMRNKNRSGGGRRG